MSEKIWIPSSAQRFGGPSKKDLSRDFAKVRALALQLQENLQWAHEALGFMGKILDANKISSAHYSEDIKLILEGKIEEVTAKYKVLEETTKEKKSEQTT